MHHESDHVAVVSKQPGLRCFGGIRTLANILASHGKGALKSSSAKDALPSPAIVHFLPAEISGCVLAAKTARAALLLSRQVPRRRLRAVLHGDAASTLQGRPEAWTVHRVAPSLRFGHISEVSLECEGDTATFRKLCASIGHCVLGDTLFGGESAPIVRRNCVYAAVDGLSFAGLEPGDGVTLSTGPVERFDRLFSKEGVAWESAMSGSITSDFVRRCLGEWEQRQHPQQSPSDAAGDRSQGIGGPHLHDHQDGGVDGNTSGITT